MIGDFNPHSLSRARAALVVVVALALVVGTLVVTRPWSWCPPQRSDAQRIDIDASVGDVMLDGRPYRVGGQALLDYTLRPLLSPLDVLVYNVRGERYPLGITASISASSREALGDPVFTCVRAVRGSDVWAIRPTTNGTQTLFDAYPPGAQPPVGNEAWRMAAATDGPEWLSGDRIELELWMSVNGRHYIFLLPTFALMRGL